MVAEESRAELAKFAKNFIPLLFNLFTAEVEDEADKTRQAVFETIKIYMQIADKQVTAILHCICTHISEDNF